MFKVFELSRAQRDKAIEIFHPQRGLTRDRPLPGQRVRKLDHLNVVEWFLEDDEVLGTAEAAHHLVPRIVRIGRADDDLQIRGHFPQSCDGFDTVPTGRHADVNERHRERAAFGQRLHHQVECIAPLKGGVDIEHRGRRGHVSKQDGLVVAQLIVAHGRREDLLEVAVDGLIVVDDEDAAVRLGRVHRGKGC